MANKGKLDSVLMNLAAATSLLLLCPVTLAEPAVQTPSQLQLLEAVNSPDQQASVWLVTDAVSLQALARRIAAISGIDVVIAPGLSQAQVKVRIASLNWDTALQQLFSNYSTAVAWDQQGKIRSFHVLASTARISGDSAAIHKPVLEPDMPDSISPARETIASQSSSPSQTIRDYEIAIEAAGVLELMNVAAGSETGTIEPLPHPQHRPGVADLLQRMRAVGHTRDKGVTGRHLATAAREQSVTAP